MSEKNEQPTGPSKLMPITIEALALQLGIDAADLQPEADEDEIAYVTRVLPLLGDKVNAAHDAKIAALKRQLASQKGASTKARAKIEEMTEAAKPRRFGPVKEPLDATDLIVAIDAAEEVALAFSDGRSELTGIAPRKLPPGCLTLRRGRIMMNEDMLVTAPGGDIPSQTLAGVALLLDGQQAAWSPLPQPMVLHGGVTINLATSVVF